MIWVGHTYDICANVGNVQSVLRVFHLRNDLQVIQQSEARILRTKQMAEDLPVTSGTAQFSV